jgi:hypothetical protein
MNATRELQRIAAITLAGLFVVATAPAVFAADGAADIDHPVLHIGGLVSQTTGVIKGVIKYEGKTPDRKPIRMDQDPYCAKYHPADKPALSELWVFGKDNATLQDVFVYVSKGLEGKKFEVPEQKKTMDQHGCMYIPHIQGIMAGQELDIITSDPTLHNVQAFPKNNPPFNEGMPVKGMVLAKKFEKTELGLMFKCAVHPWMTAYIHVMDNPYYAVTQEDGTFEIRGLPDGTYEISTKHMFPRFAPDKESVTVTIKDGKADKDVTITYSPKAAN